MQRRASRSGARGRLGLGALGIAVATSLGAPASAAPPKAGRLVFYADLADAARATPEGKRIEGELDRAREEIDAEVHAREAKIAEIRRRLERTGAPEDRAAYDRESDALGKAIDAAEARLDHLQDASLAPLLEKLRAVLQRVPEAEGVVLDTSEHPVLAPVPACVVSSWLAAAVATGTRAPLPKDEACRTRAAVLVAPAVLARGLEESREASRRLDALVRDRQAALDAHTEKLAKIPAGPAAEKERLELAARYQAYEAEVRRREREAQDKIDRAVRAFLTKVQAAHLGLLFIEALDAGAKLPIAACEGTPWLLDLLEKKRAATESPPGCPP